MFRFCNHHHAGSLSCIECLVYHYSATASVFIQWVGIQVPHTFFEASQCFIRYSLRIPSLAQDQQECNQQNGHYHLVSCKLYAHFFCELLISFLFNALTNHPCVTICHSKRMCNWNADVHFNHVQCWMGCVMAWDRLGTCNVSKIVTLCARSSGFWNRCWYRRRVRKFCLNTGISWVTSGICCLVLVFNWLL